MAFCDGMINVFWGFARVFFLLLFFCLFFLVNLPHLSPVFFFFIRFSNVIVFVCAFFFFVFFSISSYYFTPRVIVLIIHYLFSYIYGSFRHVVSGWFILSSVYWIIRFVCYLIEILRANLSVHSCLKTGFSCRGVWFPALS